jgi:hypothetical protein
MKDEKLRMKTFDHSIYKMVMNCCVQWKCTKYNKSWKSTTNFFGANIGNENDQQTWIKTTMNRYIIKMTTQAKKR